MTKSWHGYLGTSEEYLFDDFLSAVSAKDKDRVVTCLASASEQDSELEGFVRDSSDINNQSTLYFSLVGNSYFLNFEIRKNGISESFIPRPESEKVTFSFTDTGVAILEQSLVDIDNSADLIIDFFQQPRSHPNSAIWVNTDKFDWPEF